MMITGRQAGQDPITGGKGDLFMDKILLEGLTDEQKEALKKCQTKEEMMAMIDQDGIELSDAQMVALSGGCGKKNCCQTNIK